MAKRQTRRGSTPVQHRAPQVQSDHPPVAPENMPPLMRVSMVIPVGNEEKIYDFCQNLYRATGVKINLRMDDLEAVGGVEVTDNRGQSEGRRQTQAPRVGGFNGVGKKYRVVNRNIDVGQGNNAVVFAYLLARGPLKAREVWEQTGLKQKSVESSLHALRTLGAIESFEIAQD